MKSLKSIILLGVIGFGFVLFCIGVKDAKAIPAFTRKYGVSCSVCHTSTPRLNATGHRFRAAGFRWPETFGEKDEKPFEIYDYVSARAQVRYNFTNSRTGNVKQKTDLWRLQALELYPFTGPWGRYLSTNFKVTFAPGQSPAIENSYIKLNLGNKTGFASARVGIFHPFDGYGASDTPAAISRPFIQTTPANYNQNTFFTPWGFDQLGAEVGVDYGKTSIRATVFNGVVVSRRNNAFQASAAQGGALTRGSAGNISSRPDFQVVISRLLHQNGGGISLNYYHGHIALPVTGSTNFFLNKFDRATLYGSYPIIKRLQLYAGYQYGRDRLATGGSFMSRGGFVEASVPIRGTTAAGLRYDWFDPSTNKLDNALRGTTAYINAWFFDQFRVVAEFQRRDTRRGILPEQRNDIFQIRFIFIK